MTPGFFRCAWGTLMALPAVIWIPAASAQALLVSDGFEENTIDTAIWEVVLPNTASNPSTVTATNGEAVLFRRGTLKAVEALTERIDIQGSFRFTGTGEDTFSIVFRSDFESAAQNELLGVQVAFQKRDGRLFLIPEPFNAAYPIVSGFFNLPEPGAMIPFRITDNGTTVRIFSGNLVSPIITTNLSNNRGNGFAIYNSNGTGASTRVDRIEVREFATTLFIDGQPVYEGPVQKSTSATVRIDPLFPGGKSYYTLNGSTPGFTSTEYTGPFTVDSNATIRAVSYSSDFSTLSQSPAIAFEKIPEYELHLEVPGGGMVSLDPSPGPYLSNSIVTATALASAGWEFMHWEGAASVTNQSVEITMTNELTLRAVFGTQPNILTVGDGGEAGGTVQTHPEGPLFPFGSRMRLMAVPNEASYFFGWANSISGSSSPGTLLVQEANPGVTALFGVRNENQVALTTYVNGNGTVTNAPPVNVFTNGQTVELTAVPDAGQIFIGWTGAATGTDNPLSLVMNGSQSITALFNLGVRFNLGENPLTEEGFELTIEGGPGFEFDLESSPNLIDWNVVESLTNVTGVLNYLDTSATNEPRLFYQVVVP